MSDHWVHTGYAQQLHFGAGALAQLPDLVRTLGLRRILLVTTAGRRGSDEGQRLVKLLGRTLADTFDGVQPHVPTSTVQEVMAAARRAHLDGVVSFGGGSAIDTAKAVCFFMEQEAGTPSSSFHDRPMTAHVAVPTTYSGSEATGYFGVTDERTKVKSGAGGPTTTPIGVVYDPLVTLDLSLRSSMATAMNALAHCVEVAYSPATSPEAEAVALAGAGRIVAAMPRVAADLTDVDARAALLTGAALGGRCLQNGRAGAHHGLAQLLGARTGIPHGVANAVLLAHVMRFNADVVPEAMARLARAWDTELDPADFVAALAQEVSLPARLSSLGIAEEELEVVARLSQGHPLVQRNVRPVGEQDALAILRDAW